MNQNQNLTVHIADYVDFGVGTNDSGENFFVVGIYKEIAGGKISEFYSLPLSELLEAENLISELVSEATVQGYVE